MNLQNTHIYSIEFRRHFCVRGNILINPKIYKQRYNSILLTTLIEFKHIEGNREKIYKVLVRKLTLLTKESFSQ